MTLPGDVSSSDKLAAAAIAAGLGATGELLTTLRVVE